MRWDLQIKILVNVDGVICSAVPYWALIVKRYRKPKRKLKLVKAIWLMQRGWGGEQPSIRFHRSGWKSGTAAEAAAVRRRE